MSKLPRFLIAHNVAADPDGLFLVHTQFPKFIGRVWPVKGEIIRINELCQQYGIECGCRTDRLPSGEYYLMGVIMKLDEIPLDESLPKLMSRTGDWLFNYFKNLPK